MTKSIDNINTQYQVLIPIIAAVFLITGCAGFGDTEVSLLPRSKLADPLEVPPGLSPLPEPEQFVVPGQLETDPDAAPDLGPEQLRAYKLWLEFEQFKQYQHQLEGAGLTQAEYQQAKLSGEGIFRIATVEEFEEQTIRLEVFDNIDSVWNMLPSVLADMSAYVAEVNDSTRTILVGNTGGKETRSLLARFRLKEYSGSVDKLQVRELGNNKVEIIALTDQDVLVNPKAGREFFERLRFYLLARYEVEETALPEAREVLLSKQLIQGDDGRQAILLSESFESTWVRVGRTLQGAGAGIQDMNRSEGIYYVSFAESAKQRKKKKKRRWQFWRRKEVALPEQLQYQVFVNSRGEQTEVAVEFVGDTAAEDYDPDAAQKLLLIIYERLTA